MSRKRNHRMHRIRINAAALENVVTDSRAPNPQSVVVVMNSIRAAYQRLKEGTGDVEDVNQLGVMLNIGLVRAQSIGKPLAEAFEEGGNAMRECERIQEQHGKYGFTGQGLLQMNAAIGLYEDVLAESSPHQMAQASDEAFRGLREHALATQK